MAPPRPNGDGAFSHKINYVTIFLGDSKSQRACKFHYWFKSYADFAEWVDFAYWWSFSGGVSATGERLNYLLEERGQ